jgi:RimJ/RimL family protein N-acetyltransferase
MHLLMAPNNKPVKGLTKVVVAAFLKFYFSFSIANRMYGEPDKENYRAKRLLEYLGFDFLKEINLSYKTASLYCLERENFNSIII